MPLVEDPPGSGEWVLIDGYDPTEGWHTVESARDQWVDAPTDDGADEDATLLELLEVAKGAVLAYAPAVEDLEVPTNYRVAQLMQMRNIWNSSKASPAGEFDNGSYGLSSFPLDWQIRQILRPKQGKPVIA